MTGLDWRNNKITKMQNSPLLYNLIIKFELNPSLSQIGAPSAGTSLLKRISAQLDVIVVLFSLAAAAMLDKIDGLRGFLLLTLCSMWRIYCIIFLCS